MTHLDYYRNKSALQTDNTTNLGVYFICGLLAVIILMIDLNVPLGIASGIPYIVVILYALKSPKTSFTYITALICTLFVVIGYFGSPPAPDNVPVYQVYANRSLAIFAIWTTAILTLLQRDKTNELYQERLKNLQSVREIELQEERLKILKATMRTVQDITGNFLNNLQFIQLEIEKDKTLSTDSIRMLDELTREASLRIKKLSDLEEIREKRMAGGAMGIDYERPMNTDATRKEQ